MYATPLVRPLALDAGAASCCTISLPVLPPVTNPICGPVINQFPTCGPAGGVVDDAVAAYYALAAQVPGPLGDFLRGIKIPTGAATPACTVGPVSGT